MYSIANHFQQKKALNREKEMVANIPTSLAQSQQCVPHP